jgi:hypothetical protein
MELMETVPFPAFSNKTVFPLSTVSKKKILEEQNKGSKTDIIRKKLYYHI